MQTSAAANSTKAEQALSPHDEVSTAVAAYGGAGGSTESNGAGYPQSNYLKQR